MIGVYFSLFMFSKVVKMATASPAPPPAPVVATASAGELTGNVAKFGFEPPTLEPDTFTAWSENAENWKKWEEFMSGPKFDLWVEGKL